eukprot:TRINITY_DN584_c0_g2_i2.p1 TRINITY_DN584_c0_g2~~TRINITY_DN584_c0_g2_i2.p1  ORF type:complete len:675 (-),score=146.94 TRINITY_DN584_c0_g2_i2:72-2096(-)
MSKISFGIIALGLVTAALAATFVIWGHRFSRTPMKNIDDPNTLSNYKNSSVDDYWLKIQINHEHRIIIGKATYSFEEVPRDTILELDIEDLEIVQVSDSYDNDNLPFEIHDPPQGSETVGQQLRITLNDPHERRFRHAYEVRIIYRTKASSKAFHWIQGKQIEPMVIFTSYPHNAKALFPVLNTPAKDIRIGGYIKVTDGQKLYGFGKQEKASHWAYEPEQNEFLIGKRQFQVSNLALIAGDFTETVQGSGITVASTNNVQINEELLALSKAFMTHLKQRHGFDRFDNFTFVVMPNNFPHDAYVTPDAILIHPSLLSKDSSRHIDLVSKLGRAYYPGHSPFRSWDSTWIHEAFTRYVFRSFYAMNHSDHSEIVDARIGYLRMVREARRLGEDYTSLKPEIVHRNALEIAVPVIQGEKGYHVLLQLAKLTRPQVLTGLVHDWTAWDYGGNFRDFIELFSQVIRNEYRVVNYIPLESMLTKLGIPESQVDFNIPELEEIKRIVNAYLSSHRNDGPPNYMLVKFMSQKLQLAFFEELLARSDEVDVNVLARLSNDLDDVINGDYDELKSAWFQLCSLKDYMRAADAMTEFLSSTGLLDHIRPIYRNLKENGRFLLAQNLLDANSKFYHPLVTSLIMSDLSSQHFGRSHDKYSFTTLTLCTRPMTCLLYTSPSPRDQA